MPSRPPDRRTVDPEIEETMKANGVSRFTHAYADVPLAAARPGSVPAATNPKAVAASQSAVSATDTMICRMSVMPGVTSFCSVEAADAPWCVPTFINDDDSIAEFIMDSIPWIFTKNGGLIPWIFTRNGGLILSPSKKHFCLRFYVSMFGRMTSDLAALI